LIHLRCNLGLPLIAKLMTAVNDINSCNRESDRNPHRDVKLFVQYYPSQDHGDNGIDIRIQRYDHYRQMTQRIQVATERDDRSEDNEVDHWQCYIGCPGH